MRPRLLVALVLLGCCALGLPVAVAGPAVAETPPPSVAPDLAAVPVDSADFRTATARFDAASAALADAQQVLATSQQLLERLTNEDAGLTSTLATQTQQKKQAMVDAVSARASLRAIAVASYVNGAGRATDSSLTDSGLTDSAATMDLSSTLDSMARKGLEAAVSTDQFDKAEQARADLDRLARSIDDVIARRTDVRRQTAEAEAAQQRAAAAEAHLASAKAAAQTDLDRARITAVVVGADFQLVALDAYRRAAAVAAFTDPRCGLPWWALAGITRVESKHGTFGGSTLLANGDTSRPIVGIPLDGENATEAIPDTDGGALDGDPVYDRAVGPMQFIPSTWRRYQRDGNDDHVADPSSIYDAAAAAARYLCASGPMQTDEELARGFFSYNHSAAYAKTVLAYSKVYAGLPLPVP